MAWLLALDATEQSCSVALAMQPDTILSRREILPRKHAEKLLPMVDSLLSEAGISAEEITAIAVSIGPGAFTGIRIACCIAQGLAFGWGCPIVPISSLEAMGRQALLEHTTEKQGQSRQGQSAKTVLIALDARLGELYTACYSYEGETSSVFKPLIAPSLLTPLQLMEQVESSVMFDQLIEQGVCAAGSGLKCLPELNGYFEKNDIYCAGLYSDMQADAEDVLHLGWRDLEQGKIVSAEALQPLYLRRPVQK